jgi:hypothetical protein
MTDHATLTRRLNDMTRTQAQIANATWVMTRAVAALLTTDDEPPMPDGAKLDALRGALARFSDWSVGNDPYGEHDFGALTLFGHRLFFKIDYYHPDHDTDAPLPFSTELCRWVLTIMLAEEY